MSVFKKIGAFIDAKKADKHFKRAGAGNVLGSEPTAPRVLPPKVGDKTATAAPAATVTSSETRKTDDPARSAAAQAALARAQARGSHDAKPRAFGGLCEREAAAAKSALSAATAANGKPVPAPPGAIAPVTPALLNVSIRFVCPACGEARGAAQSRAHIAACLAAAVGNATDEEAADAPLPVLAALMATCAASPEQLHTATQTLQRYVGNVVSDPMDGKFRRIKLSNKVFVNTVAIVAGAVSFLRALGFEPATSEEGDALLVLPDHGVPRFLDMVPAAIDALASAVPATGTLHRDLHVYTIDSSAGYVPSRFVVPDEFYTVTTADVVSHAEARKQEIERDQTLRTQAMRDDERARGRRRTQYAVVRFRVGTGIVLQAIFSAAETVGCLRDFVASTLADPTLEFALLQPGLPPLDDCAVTLWDAGLTPQALLVVNFPVAQFAAGASATSPLLPALVDGAEPLRVSAP